MHATIHKGQRVELVVENDGPGIPVGGRSRIFERCFRVLGTEAAGSGLGLAIVQEVAASHNAEVSVLDGRHGKGTRMVVSFSKV